MPHRPPARPPGALPPALALALLPFCRGPRPAPPCALVLRRVFPAPSQIQLVTADPPPLSSLPAAPSIFFSDASASRKRRQDAAASRGCEDPDDLGELASPEDLSPAPWQLLPRSKSWAGVVLETQQIESVPRHVLRRRKSTPSLAGALPALTQLPPPPMLPGGGPADDVDLNVDFEAEVAPYLGRCLVREGGWDRCLGFRIAGGGALHLGRPPSEAACSARQPAHGAAGP